HGPEQPGDVPAQSIPSAAVQFTAPPGGCAQSPGFVAVTGLPLGAEHTPPQHDAALKQMSPFCSHHEPAMSQTLFWQSPEQQSPSLAHAFPDVVHVGPPLLDPASPPSAPASPPPPPIAAHFPATHV